MELSDTALHAKSTRRVKPVAVTLIGLTILVFGGRFLVTGAIDLARLAGLSETMIGLTIVAVETSLPEFVTSLVAARKGEPEVAFGNVIGSNIYNIIGIGGVTMLVAPQEIPANLLPLDLGIMALSALLVLGAIWLFQGVGRVIVSLFLTGYCIFFLILIAQN